uniref:Uncharacterized protein n=1 Tax=Cucumis sativus TaxID=3659 RepID=A0A0A0L6C6_CUCSA
MPNPHKPCSSPAAAFWSPPPSSIAFRRSSSLSLLAPVLTTSTCRNYVAVSARDRCFRLRLPPTTNPEFPPLGLKVPWIFLF